MAYFEREDWTLFGSLVTLPQKAGVSRDDLPKLIVKELVDNALDAGGSCRIGLCGDNGFYVEDDGPGIPGDDAEVADLFSIGRPLRSSKLGRLPTRGALGNGLRVVVGAVLATGGTLSVSTGGRMLRLIPEGDGHTRGERIGGWGGTGTLIEIELGAALDVDDEALAWGHEALALAESDGKPYKGKPSPFWYDSDSFFDLLRAASHATVREIVATLDGCAEPKAGLISAGFKGRMARDLDRREAEALLATARANAKPVNAGRLGCVGPTVGGFPVSYTKVLGEFTQQAALGSFEAEIPYVIEVWARVGVPVRARAYVNRTPVATNLDAFYFSKENMVKIRKCEVYEDIHAGKKPAEFRISVIAPYVPITTDGKTPDLSPFADAIAGACRRAVNKAKAEHRARADRKATQKQAVLDCLDAAIPKAGGGGRYSPRQLYYVVRDMVKAAHGLEMEPSWPNFNAIITGYEAELGHDLPGIARDNRGTLYHPHTGEEIPLGTINVEKYRRPDWTFNKVLYCEKEGFFADLKETRWPERNDCALLTSKGFASRAARDVIDLLGETDEDLTFFCAHDADAYGTLIYQALQGATRARGARKVKIINLGLEPAEAINLGLPIEPVKTLNGKKKPVGDYVEPIWRVWLQGHRIELNAMTTPQFREWLDRKMEPHAGKISPPAEVVASRLEAETRSQLRERITAQILRRVNIDEKVDSSMRDLAGELDKSSSSLFFKMTRYLNSHRAEPWWKVVEEAAKRIARGKYKLSR